MPPEKLDAATLKNNLQTMLVGSEIHVFQETDSTNRLAREFLEKDAENGLVVLAERQTAGRGRFGRSWHSPAELGIYLSLVLKPELTLKHISQLTLMAGVSVILAIEEATRVPARLKWPNDVLVHGKKVAGVLCEYCAEPDLPHGVIIGIGINVNQFPDQFPDELKSLATSLRIESGEALDRTPLILSLLRHLDGEYEAFLLEGETHLIQKWSEHSDMWNRSVIVKQGGNLIEGTALRLDPVGRLIIADGQGNELAFDSGEVSLK
ncbi:MAG: biotin--[acetyl-CoA-carboxylase] ligase [Nitrospinae bacterium CG11_big_fil_rev_8_21_14_0_20_56_8]|nr:MAG: biotin--[acetyl-CoA-carboxylase] ligase [Nitrospinae bacterium CG11_big_fil_rev_8_21_14_0_20_56_8]